MMNRKDTLWHIVLAALLRAVPLLVALTLGLLLDAALLDGAVVEELVRRLLALCELRSLQCSPRLLHGLTSWVTP